MQFSLATIRHNGRPTPAIEVSNKYYALTEVAPDLLGAARRPGLMGLFDDWKRAEARLTELAGEIDKSGRGLLSPQPGPDDFMTPLQFPSKLILGGANYYEHMIKEAKIPNFNKQDGTPVFFLKPPTTSLVGCGKTVRYPVQSSKFDWEIELAVVIATTLRRASEQEVSQGIAGYAVGIDLSARDWQMNPKHPWKFDLFTGKGFDDSCPLGPKLVPARFVDPTNLDLRLSVNGLTKQHCNTRDMIWSVTELVSLLSEHVTLEPGDILLTGTPAGVGLASGTYLATGDKIEAEISGLGTLHVEIVPDTATSRTPSAG
jgi:2-keto-4-pentenoate hydratase/2-oxohepta-3-ene-1,7-dioic acid hydratase in catechol pathway